MRILLLQTTTCKTVTVHQTGQDRNQRPLVFLVIDGVNLNRVGKSSDVSFKSSSGNESFSEFMKDGIWHWEKPSL